MKNLIRIIILGGMGLLITFNTHASVVMAAQTCNLSSCGFVRSENESDLFISSSSQLGSTGSSRITQSSLHAEVDVVEGDFWQHRSIITYNDLIFSSDVPGTSTVTFGLGGQLNAVLSGLVFGAVFNGNLARVDVRLNATGNSEYIFTDQELYFQFESASYSREIDQFVSTIFSVPVGTPVSVSAELRVTGGTGIANNGAEFARTDASNSLVFNPDRFFDIQTPGVTVSDGMFLIDNQIVNANANTVPEPAAIWLLGSGLLGLLGKISRKAT